MIIIDDEWMYKYSLLTLVLISIPTYLSLQFIQAPYGRHSRPGWGPPLPPWLAWSLMESPTIFLTTTVYSLGRFSSSPRSAALLSAFLLHYLHRTLLYPLLLLLRRPPSSSVPVSVAVMGFLFNLLNAYVQSRWISHYGDYSSDGWFWVRFGFGLVLFGSGMAVNVSSDRVLLKLKGEGGGYKIPRGGMFEWVSCPNYMGEMVEWFGWGVMTWSWAGFAFFFYTCSNLVPRACAHHNWYLVKFRGQYPVDRKALIPFLY